MATVRDARSRSRDRSSKAEGGASDVRKDHYEDPAYLRYNRLVFGEERNAMAMCTPGCDLPKGMWRKTLFVHSLVPVLPRTRVLDLGAGFGGSARFLNKTFGCKDIICLNISEPENKANEAINKKAGKSDEIKVILGSCEDLSAIPSESIDVVFSEETLLFAHDRVKVFQEVKRVLVPGGAFVNSENVALKPDSPEMQACYASKRLPLQHLPSYEEYKAWACQAGLEVADIIKLDHFAEPYYRIYKARTREILDDPKMRAEVNDDDFLTKSLKGLECFIAASAAGALGFGVMHYKKPAGSAAAIYG